MISLSTTQPEDGSWRRTPRLLAGLSTHLHIVAHDFGVSEAALRGPSRMRDLSKIRQEFCLRAHVLGYSTPEIGRVLNRDHTSVLYLLGRLERKPSWSEE